MNIQAVVNMIETPAIREMAQTLLAAMPTYWWEIPASTSGKYHPQFSLGDGGLVRHSIAVAYFARRIALAQGMSTLEQDVLTLAGLIHDGLKAGRNEAGLPVAELHTVHEHPVLMAGFIRELFPENDLAETLAHVVESHMGQWTTSKYSDVVLPAPQDALQRALSAADMIAATKELAMAPGFFEEE